MFTAPHELARRILDAAPDAMIVIDGGGIVRFVNRQTCALFGYSAEEIAGTTVEQLIPERFRNRHVGHRHQYVENQRVRPMGAGLQLFGRRRDGREFPVEISLSPIESGGGQVLVAAAIRDVTERKRVEAELIDARRAAEAAHERADRANRAKSRFLATASHDLRQPLQSIGLLNGMLKRSAVDSNAAEALDQQEQSIDAMARLLNALLDISKLESGAVKPDPTDFAVVSIFREMRAEFAAIAARKGLQLRVEECHDRIHSDRALIEQLLRNLISNAIKYTRQGYVALRCWHSSHNSVRIEVLDTGIGIPGDQLGLIFDEFYQVGVPTNSTREGYGLGLSIVQRIASLLDAKLDVQSQLGKGSTFSLLLPRVTTSDTDQAPTDERNAPHPLRRSVRVQAHVLLIEDDPSVRDATRMLLRVDGYCVTAVASLAEAIPRLHATDAPDLIVADYHLANNETGAAAIVAIRDLLRRPVKAVLVTGDTSSAVRELALGPDLEIASKPIRADELLALMQRLLGQ